MFSFHVTVTSTALIVDSSVDADGGSTATRGVACSQTSSNAFSKSTLWVLQMQAPGGSALPNSTAAQRVNSSFLPALILNNLSLFFVIGSLSTQQTGDSRDGVIPESR